MAKRIDIWVESHWLGHVTRQINLMDHLRSREDSGKYTIRFIVDSNSATQQALVRAGYSFVERSPQINTAFAELASEWRDAPPDIFILDSVDHDRHEGAGPLLADPRAYSFVVIDDPADRDVECDLLLNALPGRNTERDRHRNAKRYLRGTEYLILPTEYVATRDANQERETRECRRGFAFFGGGDPEDLGGIFLDMVANDPVVPDWRMLLGPRYAHVRAVTERIEREGLPVSVVRYVPSMADTLREADVAILGAGNVLSEAAAVGTPALAMSQNTIQKENANFFAAACGVIDMGLPTGDMAARLGAALSQLCENRERRAAVSKAMMSMVDARGGSRVAAIIAGHS